MQKITRAQMEALHGIFKRSRVVARGPRITLTEPITKARSYLKFRRTARFDPYLGCVMVPWAGMWLGIEDDGYTHS